MSERIAPGGMHHYDTAEWLSFLGDKAIAALVSAAAHATSPRSMIVVKRMGGATSRVPADGTAFWHRQAAHTLNVHAEWTPGELLWLSGYAPAVFDAVVDAVEPLIRTACFDPARAV